MAALLFARPRLAPGSTVMLPTFVRRASQARTPMIRFLGRRDSSGKSEEPHPHPQAPKSIRSDFDHFLKRQRGEEPRHIADPPSPSGGGGGGGGGGVGGGGAAAKNKRGSETVYEYESVYDLPKRYWRESYAPFSDHEIELINGGGVVRG